jgi:hypothetical protein
MTIQKSALVISVITLVVSLLTLLILSTIIVRVLAFLKSVRQSSVAFIADTVREAATRRLASDQIED